MNKAQKVWMWILAILVVSLLGYIVYGYFKDKKTTSTTPTTSTSTITSVSPTATTITHVSDPGVTWLDKPEVLSNLGLFKSDGTYIDTELAKYWKVADIDDGSSIILSQVSYNSPGGPSLVRFVKNKDGKYHYLTNHSAWQDYNEAKKNLIDDVIIDGITRFNSLSFPLYYEVNGQKIKSVGTFYNSKLFADLTDPTKIGDTAYGIIYQVRTNAKSTGTELEGVNLQLKLPDGSTAQYAVETDFMPENKIALVTWKDGTKNTKAYTAEAYAGCGSSMTYNIVLNTADIKTRLQETGTTEAGEKIYTVAKDDAIIKAAYDNYNGQRPDAVSIDDFVNQHPIFIYKDILGDYVVYTNTDFKSISGCGKPVIYLYPEKDTQVSVKVGADIVKSEPLYDNGWTVLAHPDGMLDWKGTQYDSLFWEGYGGEYPEITSGFVVETKNIESTLYDHLAKLGLNEKESADFMEFWLPKMPTTAYTRLTWFGTAQMNALAPLSVNPAPDTTIRIFLDFEGLNKPIDIPAQKLSAPARNGFTLIEWGGLLRDGIK